MFVQGDLSINDTSKGLVTIYSKPKSHGFVEPFIMKCKEM